MLIKIFKKDCTKRVTLKQVRGFNRDIPTRKKSEDERVCNKRGRVSIERIPTLLYIE